jgi:hypothetical protein
MLNPAAIQDLGVFANLGRMIRFHHGAAYGFVQSGALRARKRLFRMNLSTGGTHEEPSPFAGLGSRGIRDTFRKLRTSNRTNLYVSVNTPIQRFGARSTGHV